MSKYKYPYVPKEYYPAVMFACKIIREHGTFNRAIEAASDYYNVDEDTLIKHVRARQAAGQKGRKSPTAGKKLKWWIIPTYQNAPHELMWEIEPSVRRGYSGETVRNTLRNADRSPIWSEHFKSYGDAVGPFDTKKEALDAASIYVKEHGLDVLN